MSEPDKPQPPPPQYGAYPGGYPPQPQQPYSGYPPPPPAASPKNGLGIASLVIAIIGLLTVFGGVILGFVAVILGFVGWRRAKRGEATNGGVAVAGIVLGLLGIIASIAVIAFVVWGFNKAGGTDYVDCISKAGSDEQAIQQCADQFQQHVEDEFNITITTGP